MKIVWRSPKTLFGILLLCLLFGVAVCVPRFPSDKTIDRFWTAFDSETRGEVKSERLQRIVRKLHFTQDNEDDDVALRFVQRLETTYLTTHDISILEGLSKAKLNAGIGTLFCGFYAAVKSDPIYMEQCRNRPDLQHAMRRCEGMSLDHGDTEKLFVPNPQ